MATLGITEVKELATAAAKLGTAAGRILEDGKVGLADMVHVPMILGGLKDLSGVEFASLLPELKDLSEGERDELAAHFGALFDLPNDGVEAIVEQGLAIVLMALEAILAFVKVGDKVKKAAA